MEMAINSVEPLIMHIDLNSCYAIIEQQANRLLRHKPLAVAAYTSPSGFIVASSYEAKRQGIKLMRVRDAKSIDPKLIVLAPDPEKYFDAHRRFKRVLEKYTDLVTPKSIDEFIVDFRGSQAVQRGISLKTIGYQIKADIKQALGEYVTVNIGIGPNRFYAKVAAGMDKPDGLTIIRGQDIYNVLGQLDLLDLPGINKRYRARLMLDGNIRTPLDFAEAPLATLRGPVFKSINGYYWYLRLRGHEIDAERFMTRSFGNDFAIRQWTHNRQVIERYMIKLAEKTGRRLRRHGFLAHGVYLGLAFDTGAWWGKSMRFREPIYSTQDIYFHLKKLLKTVDFPGNCTHINVSVMRLEPVDPQQTSLFAGTRLDSQSLARAADAVNDRYGEFTLAPAAMANMQDVIIKRVPFGSVRDL